MSKVYSLVCWGGRVGKTISISASTDRATLNNHGLRTGQRLWFSGTLPAELSSVVPYWARYYDANQFTIHTSEAGALAGTDQALFAGSSTYASVTAVSGYWVSLSAGDKSRYGESGSELVYDGIKSWNTGRAGASPFNEEVCEIGEAFSEYHSGSAFNITVPSAQNTIWSKVNDIRSEAWHAGNYPGTAPTAKSAGYVFIVNGSVGSGTAIGLTRYYDKIDGITILQTVSFGVGVLVNLGKGKARIGNCWIIGYGTGSPSSVVQMAAPMVECVGNIVLYGNAGIAITNQMAGILVANNIISRATSGMYATTAPFGFYYNNISIGNTTNWAAATLTNVEGSSNNFGLTGEAWIVGSGTRGVLATSDFVDYTNNNFRPLASSSPQVEAGVAFLGYPTLDFADTLRPNYRPSPAGVIDAGPHEWDWGNGLPPSSTTVTFVGVHADSEIRVYDSDDTEIAGVESCAENPSLTWTAYEGESPLNVVTIRIVADAYEIIEFSYTSIVGNVALPIQQTVDRWAYNPA